MTILSNPKRTVEEENNLVDSYIEEIIMCCNERMIDRVISLLEVHLRDNVLQKIYSKNHDISG